MPPPPQQMWLMHSRAGFTITRHAKTNSENKSCDNMQETKAATKGAEKSRTNGVRPPQHQQRDGQAAVQVANLHQTIIAC